MERFGDLYLDLNQNEANLEDVNLNAVLVELDKGGSYFDPDSNGIHIALTKMV